MTAVTADGNGVSVVQFNNSVEVRDVWYLICVVALFANAERYHRTNIIVDGHSVLHRLVGVSFVRAACFAVGWAYWDIRLYSCALKATNKRGPALCAAKQRYTKATVRPLVGPFVAPIVLGLATAVCGKVRSRGPTERDVSETYLRYRMMVIVRLVHVLRG